MSSTMTSAGASPAPGTPLISLDALDLPKGSKDYPRIVGIRVPGAATGLCVVLDIDECLLHTFFGKKDLLELIKTDPRYLEVRSRLFEIEMYDSDPSAPKGTGKKETAWGVFRPHLELFMSFLFAHCYTICFWTAGVKEYADACIQKICRGIKQPFIVMTRDDVEYIPTGMPPPDDVDYHKPLAKVMALDPANIKPSMTIFIDDKGSNFVSAPNNGIQIVPYRPAADIRQLQTDDICLLQVRQWILELQTDKPGFDVRKLDKSHIFTTPLHRVPPKSQVYYPKLKGSYRTPMLVMANPELEKGYRKLIDV